MFSCSIVRKTAISCISDRTLSFLRGSPSKMELSSTCFTAKSSPVSMFNPKYT